MKNKIQKSILAGVVATAVMTAIMLIAPMMGMPKMNPAEMLSGMMGFPLAVGWFMHFMIGVIFALLYSVVFSEFFQINNKIFSGALFGFVVFLFAQVMMFMMNMMIGGMMQPEGSMVLMMIGSIFGHIIFGIVVSIVVNK